MFVIGSTYSVGVGYKRFEENTTNKDMGRLVDQEHTLCLKIQDPADVALGLRILRRAGLAGSTFFPVI